MPTELLGIPVPFILFAFTLLGVAVLHHHVLKVALVGLTAILTYTWFVGSFPSGQGWPGLTAHLAHEWVTLLNLFGLLTAFAILARHFEKTRIPYLLPKYLPDDWRGAFLLLVIIFTLSGFLDNIAAAMVGAAMAHSVFQGRVHIGFLAAIVAASNAGGAGSVVGDTTTTMIWLSGVSPLKVLEAYIPAFVALVIFGIPAARLQQAYSPILKNVKQHPRLLDVKRISIVAAILGAAIGVNVALKFIAPELKDSFPWMGAMAWAAIIATITIRRPDWSVVPEAAKGSIFLLALVLCASLMPVDALPTPTWQTTLGLGFISSFFDNIPLTKLALEQGGYDWGFLAFAVGFGGSMLWFGSTAGIAVSNLYPEAKSVFRWVRYGWPIIIGYVAGYFTLLLLVGWKV